MGRGIYRESAPPPIIFARIVRPMLRALILLKTWRYISRLLTYLLTYNECFTTLLLTFYTKKLCSRLSSSEVRFYTENGRFAFFELPGGVLWATYDDLWKRIVDFLLV